MGATVNATLSILIPTITTRAQYLARLLAVLEPQATRDVEILTLRDNGELPIGAKRNALLARARARYLAFVDDDDLVSDDYVASILEAAKGKPDVITFDMERVIDGTGVGVQRMSLASEGKYLCTMNADRLTFSWFYPPTHLCAFRSTIAKWVTFKEKNQGEDTDWQDRVFPLLKTERHIDKVLYRYLHRSERPGEVTNLYRKDWGTL